MYSQLTESNGGTSAELVSDLFSTTFAKSFQLAADVEKSKLIHSLRENVDVIANTSPESFLSQRACILLLLGSLTGESSQVAESDLFTALLDPGLSVDATLSTLASPVVTRTLTNLMSVKSQQRLLNAFDMMLLPRLESDDQKIALLNACPLLATDVEIGLKRTIADAVDWCRSDTRRSSDLELTLTVLVNTPRMALFRQLQNRAVLKEQFLVAVAVALRTGKDLSDLAPITAEVQQMLFFVPNVGVVMDRWLDKELKKYNADCLNRIKQVPIESLRVSLKSAFPNTDETFIQIPFDIEQSVADIVDASVNDDKKFRFLPLALSLDSAIAVLRLAPTWFEIVGAKARLTPSAMAGHSAQAPSKPEPIAPSAGDDLIDILLREILAKLPEHAFLNRPLPVKVQPGVYRFGTREVTFHTKAGKLFVFRVGGYVSESDAAEFVAREFSVSFDKLRTLAATGKPAAPHGDLPGGRPPTAAQSTGLRRPMEWDNPRFLARLVRRGLKDSFWRNAWESMSLSERDPRRASLETLQKFVEQNVAHAVRQEWARELLYFVDKKDGAESSDSDPGAVHQARGPDHPNFKTRLCLNFPQGRCTRGAACAYAHGESDLRAGPGGTIASTSQPQFYKTRMCNAFIDGRCSRGASCNYAHSEAERLSFSSGVVKRDVKSSQDIRMAAKMEARDRSSSRSRSRSRTRRRRRSDDL